MILSRFVAIGMILSIISASPANALFGSECKKPKTSYFQQHNQAQELKRAAYAVTPQDKASHYLREKKRAEAGLKICSQNNMFTEKECNAFYELAIKTSKMPLFYQEKMSQANIRFNTAYRIVLNNQKCFDPIVVVEAQRFLGK